MIDEPPEDPSRFWRRTLFRLYLLSIAVVVYILYLVVLFLLDPPAEFTSCEARECVTYLFLILVFSIPGVIVVLQSLFYVWQIRPKFGGNRRFEVSSIAVAVYMIAYYGSLLVVFGVQARFTP